jgi:hypothetical protein
MTTIDVLVKNAPSRNLVSERKPPDAPPDPYAAGCPTRMLLDRIGDKWTVLTLSLIRDKPRRATSSIWRFHNNYYANLVSVQRQ